MGGVCDPAEMAQEDAGGQADAKQDDVVHLVLPNG
jgi:hypothetical protein